MNSVPILPYFSGMPSWPFLGFTGQGEGLSVGSPGPSGLRAEESMILWIMRSQKLTFAGLGAGGSQGVGLALPSGRNGSSLRAMV